MEATRFSETLVSYSNTLKKEAEKSSEIFVSYNTMEMEAARFSAIT
jgi:hypothetical protein